MCSVDSSEDQPQHHPGPQLPFYTTTTTTTITPHYHHHRHHHHHHHHHPHHPPQGGPTKHMTQTPSPPPPASVSPHTVLLLYERSPRAHHHHHRRRHHRPRSPTSLTAEVFPAQQALVPFQHILLDSSCSCGVESSLQGHNIVQIMYKAEERLLPWGSPPSRDPHTTSVRRPRVTTRFFQGPSWRGLANGASLGSHQLLMILTLCLLLAGGTRGSEFPDRECCDSVPPPPPHYHRATSTTTTTPTPTPRTGLNTSAPHVHKGVSGVMSCLEARQQCRNEPRCRDVLTLLHKVCGPELVACATVTPAKCKMLLRNLNAFDYLTTCTCDEPHIDFTCYTFRETIFNHPCNRVETVDLSNEDIKMCNVASKDCRQNRACFKDYLDFAEKCSYDGITCTSKNSEKCNEHWNKIRKSPLFGCVCSQPPSVRVMAYRSDRMPSGGYEQIKSSSHKDDESCLTVYNLTHANPCLEGQKDDQRSVEVEGSQSTCHQALEECQGDDKCRSLLEKVNVWCEHSHCEPDRCRSALQDFYYSVNVVTRLKVAFCVCRKSDPDGECLTAMRKLHPTCAERHTGRDPLKCHKIAEQCRNNPVCRDKLEEYEQKCAADAMTGRCSDTHRSCQQAVMNILGTELHATCVCKGTDFLHQHDCYTWQKLLWSNPCVIESHLKLHEEISNGNTALDKVFQRPPAIRTTATPSQIYMQPTPEGGDFYRPSGGFGLVVHTPSESDLGPRPSGGYGQDRSSIWDSSRRTGLNIGRNIGGGGRGNHRGGVNIGGSSGIGLVGGGRNNLDMDRGGGGAYPTSRWESGSSGRSWGGRNGGVYGGRSRNGGTGVLFGNRNSGPGRENGGPGVSVGNGFDGNGRSWESNSRNRGLSVGRDRGKGGYGGPVIKVPYGSGPGRNGLIGPGHRGTPIVMQPEQGENWRGPGMDRNAIGRQGLGKWHTNGGFNPAETDLVTGRPPPMNLPEARPSPYGPTPPVLLEASSTAPGMFFPTESTTDSVPTTTVPQRTCKVEVESEIVVIPEGNMRRVYKESDCSELCYCRPGSPHMKLEASCNILTCIDNKHCNTTSAHFPHTAPYYLAYRGLCDCYGGNFICQKPDPEEYNIGLGVYLFLGYSRGEMEILKPYTKSNELEAVKVMERILVQDYNFKCTLDIKNHIGENFIVVAQLIVIPDGPYISPLEKQRKEKECSEPLNELAKKINSRPRHKDILTDAHLSMFILAEVVVNIPEAQTSLNHVAPIPALDALLLLLSLLATLLTPLLPPLLTCLAVSRRAGGSRET